MATTQNTYTGNGSATNYSFTFEYLKQSDVKVTLDTVATTAFTFANATTISFTSAPASNVAIRIFRDTAIDLLSATFFPGSAIKAEDLNQNFTQSLYVTQEADAESLSATTTANTAKATADTALTNSSAAVTSANAAVTTANTADTNASAAVTTANAASATATTASTAAASAVTTANTASTNASAAVTTANSAATDAATAISTANGAVTTANAATTTANTAQSTATSATSTANTAATNASNAVTTANAATTTANTADTNATAAVNTANAASAAVSNAVLFTLIANVAAIPASPSNNDYVEMGNSTGVESFSPLSGVPSGFVGASGLTVRLRYDTSATSWVWMSYFANDSETRYLTKNIPVVTGDATNGSGQITLNCEVNTHGVKIKGPPHSAGANYTLTLPNDAGTSGNVLKTDGSGTTSWGSADVVNDTTPQLGGNLDVNGKGITNVTLITGSTPSLRGAYQGTASLSTLGSLGNSIPSELKLTNTSLELYFNNNKQLSMGVGDDLVCKSGIGLQRSDNNVTTYIRVGAGTTTQTYYYWPNADGSAGQALTTDGSGVMSWSSVDSAFIETPQAISTNKVIAANVNAGMMGPTVSINSGISITVGANSHYYST